MTFHKFYFVLIFFFFSVSLNAMSALTDLYQIKNVSGEDLKITIQYSGYDEIGLFPPYYYLRIDDEIINVPLPYQSQYPYETLFELFECYPERKIERTVNGNYYIVYNKTRNPKEMLCKVIKELILYDKEGGHPPV